MFSIIEALSVFIFYGRGKMNKVVLITGASSGIGLNTALAFIKEGFTVYAAARRIELMKSISENGGNVLPLDLFDDASMIKCVEEIISREGRIDVLVNNAGYGLGGSIEDVPVEEAKKQFDVNVFGMSRMIQLVLLHMRNQKSGRIINVSSMAGKFSSPFTGWYHASKYCVESLSDALRLEVKPFGIKVCIVEPGKIQTDWGVIHASNIRRFSAKSAYSENADSVAAWYEKGYSVNKNLSKPEVITKLILKAAKSKFPKIRYQAGKGAKSYPFIRQWTCDKLFDFILAKNLHLKGKM